MPIIRINKELYNKLKEDKGNKTFGGYISQMIYSEGEDRIKKIVKEEVERLRYA